MTQARLATGVRVYARSPVITFGRVESNWIVTTDHGRVVARSLNLATTLTPEKSQTPCTERGPRGRSHPILADGDDALLDNLRRTVLLSGRPCRILTGNLLCPL